MIKTEMRNEDSYHIDRMSTADMMRLMQNENMNAVRAIEGELEAIGRAVDAISERMERGGRLFYIGCGTSVTNWYTKLQHVLFKLVPDSLLTKTWLGMLKKNDPKGE